MFPQCFIGEHSGWTNLCEVTAERTFESSIFFTAEINVIVGRENIQIVKAGIVLIKANTPVTLNAEIHFMMNESAEVLIFVCTFLVLVPAVVMASHFCHIRQMAAFASIPNRPSMRLLSRK